MLRKMQIFPDDTRDTIERKHAKQVLAEFPSYGKFWEKFIGDGRKYSHVLTPREPVFPKSFSNSDKENIQDTQILLSKVSYSIFCNLIAAENQLEEYEKTLPLSNEHFSFWAIESFECAYFHIGNVTYALTRIWGKIRKIFFSPLISQQTLDKYLEGKKKGKNWLSLTDEPKNIRDNLVHLSRHIFRQHKNNLYLPLYVEKDKYLWRKMKINGWMTASEKLHNHIRLTYATCENVYSSIIPDIQSYLKNQGIMI